MTSNAATPFSRGFLFSWKAHAGELGLGGLCGAAVVLWSHQFLAMFGTSTAAVSAFTLAVGGSNLIACSIRSRTADTAVARWIKPVGWLMMAALTVTFSWLLAAARWFTSHIPVSVLMSEAAAFCVMLLLTATLLMPPLVACLCLSNSATRQKSGIREGLPPLSLLGIAFGLIVVPAVIAPLVGLPVLMALITTASAVGFWRSLSQSITPSNLPNRTRTSRRPSSAIRPSWWVMGLSLLIGMLVPVVSRFATELMPGSPFEHYAVWAGLVGGIGIGLMWAAFVSRRSSEIIADDGPLVAAAVATLWPIALLIVWGWLVDGFLFVNASVSVVPLVMLLRIAMAVAATAPLGIALGRLWGSPKTGGREPSVGVLCLVAGIVLSQSTSVPLVASICVVTIAAMIVLVGRYWMLGLPTLERRQQFAGLLTVLSIALLPAVGGNYRPDQAAKLLFSTQTFSALHSGISRELLPHLDDSRLVSMREGRTATWTIWKQRGSQLVLRENGLPRGVLSTDPDTSPQFAGEVMPAVVPMVLHERPESVLMLGLGSTAPLTSVLACPVTSITCIEPDADLIAIVDEVFAPATGSNPLDDDRVRLWNGDPTLALLGRGDRYDVLIINQSQPSIMSAASGFTCEYYRAARRSLHVDGILCQRLQYADFGRQPLEDLLATVQAVFPQVALFDAAPGEMLIIASNKTEPLVSETTIDRCESTHIRNLMAQVGWDWSVLLNLGALSPDSVAELTAAHGTPNTVGNGRFAFGLPQEVMRWSTAQLPKWQERQQLLNAHASHMLAWVGDSERTKDVQQRLADVIEQQRLISEHPDHFWAYRKTLKERLTERPRGVIQQVKHEGLKRSLHPEDRRRKEYLEVLSTAATASEPDPRDVRRLDDFAVPYDPLVSYFLHQEAARLYEKSAVTDPTAEFGHLRYSIYFGPPSDQSVRNVVTALQLVNDHPELIADPLERWDEMNSLLEVLKQRSSLRLRADQTASSFELVDAERSITIAKRTMATMDTLCAQIGTSAEGWSQRKTVLERMLVRPMWKYHSRQASLLARQHAHAKALTESR